MLLPSTSPILCTDTCKYSQTHIHKSTHSFYCPPRTLDVKKVPRSLYLSLILSVSRSLCPSVLLSLCVSLCRPVTLFLCLSVCRSADSLSLYLSVSLARFPSLLLVSVALSLSVSLFHTHIHHTISALAAASEFASSSATTTSSSVLFLTATCSGSMPVYKRERHQPTSAHHMGMCTRKS